MLIAGAAHGHVKLDKAFAARIAPYMPLVRKWAKARGLPVAWVVATIKVESGGNPAAMNYRPPIETSYGLMQINTIPYGERFGVTGPELIANPGKSIEIGTLLMRERLDKIKSILKGRTPPIPLDQILRISYPGPEYLYAALRAGRDPRTAYVGAMNTVANWQEALATTRAIV